MLKDTQPTTVVRVARWVQLAVIIKPAVYVASAVFEQIIERLDEEGSWTSLSGWFSGLSGRTRNRHRNKASS